MLYRYNVLNLVVFRSLDFNTSVCYGANANNYSLLILVKFNNCKQAVCT